MPTAELLGWVFFGLAALLIVAQAVCWILVLVKIFGDNAGLGVLGVLCSLFAFLYGWVKAAEYGTRRLMVCWTLLVIGAIVCLIVSGVVSAPAGG
jgi:hypothetical protein